MMVAFCLTILTIIIVGYLVRLASRPPAPPAVAPTVAAPRTVGPTGQGTQTDRVVHRIEKPSRVARANAVILQLNVEELKEALRKSEQSHAGTKPVLVEKLRWTYNVALLPDEQMLEDLHTISDYGHTVPRLAFLFRDTAEAYIRAILSLRPG